ncbi:MAG: hypothetical protein HYX49_05095 [Chloroflexi bacterium]|nr:hypothetical protein [Chloroflexota bacterium]
MNAIGQIIYNLLNSQVFWVLLLIWIFICIAWVERWKPLFERLGKLFLKPVIFKPALILDDIPFYPRSFMEESANGLRDTLRKPFSDIIRVFSGWVGNQYQLIYDRERPFRTLGHILFFGSFLFFVLADAIAVANTLQVLRYWSGTMPPILTRFDLAVFGGSLLALIIGIVHVSEIQSNNSEFSRWSERDNRTKALTRAFSFLVALLSLITLIAWALFRLIELGKLQSNPILDTILNWILFGLVPINSALGAAITFSEAMIGFVVAGVLIEWILIGILYLIDYAATILGTILPFVFDLAYRLVYIIVDILQWFITTPVQLVMLPFRLIAKTFSN